jgi:hypothetical protein
MRTSGAVLAGLALVTTLALAASADEPPVRHGPGDTAHTHHVHTGGGNCISIDSVWFLAVDHGLHRGASETHSDRLGHGPCH